MTYVGYVSRLLVLNFLGGSCLATTTAREQLVHVPMYYVMIKVFVYFFEWPITDSVTHELVILH